MGTSLPPVGVRFQAEGVPQVTGAFDQLANKSRQTGTQIGGTFVAASGRVTAFGRSSVQAINATGFAVSQLASTGQVGFKSLASSTAGFASFFGAGGLIASGVISLGLVLADFWQRQRKEAEATEKVMKSLGEAAVTRRAKDEPVAVAGEQLAIARQAVVAINDEIAALLAREDVMKRGVGGEITFNSKLEALMARKGDALQKEMEALRQVNDARAKSTESENKEVQALAASIGARRATNGEIQRANMLLSQARFILDLTKNASVEDTAAMKRRGEALKVLTTLTDAFKKAQDAVTEAEQKRRAAIADQVNQLSALSAINKLTGQQVFQLALLYARLNTELLTGNVTLERRVQIEQQLATIRKASLQAPPFALTPSSEQLGPLLPGEKALPGRGGSQRTITLSPADQRRLQTGGSFRQTRFVNPPDAGSEFGEAFAQSLQTGLASGVTQFLASGSIEGMWNSVGSALVTGLATINPWLAVAGGIFQGLIATMLGGGSQRPRAPELPIDIRRVITDPSFRQPVRVQPNPVGRPLYVNTPAGNRQLRAWTGAAGGRGIP